MISFLQKPFRSLVLISAVLAVAGCGAVDVMSNPLAPKKRPLPGEREAVLPQMENVNGVASIAGAGSMGDWSQPGGNAANNPGHVSAGATSRVWRSSIGEGSGKKRRLSAAPVVSGGVVFTLDAAGTVVASNASSGGRIWRASILPEGEKGDGVIGGGLAVSGNGLYVTSPFGAVHAFDASTGGQVWKKDLPIAVRGAPTVADGKVFLSDRNNTVYALNTADGEIVWELPTIPETSGVVSSSSPAYGSGIVVVPMSSGDVVAINAAKGEAIWTDSLTKTGRFAGFASLQDVSARPVIADGVVYSVGVSGRMIAVNLKDGRRLWENDIASAYMPIVSGGAIFAVTVDGRVVAVDRKSGELVWTQQLDTGPRKKRISYAGPILANARLYVGSSEGQLLSFDASNGQPLNSVSIGEAVLISPIAVGGRVYVMGDRGSLTALQ